MTQTIPAPSRGKGYVRNVKDRTHGVLGVMLGALAASMPPETATLEDLLPMIDVQPDGSAVLVRDQKTTSACVGFSLAEAIALRIAYLRAKAARAAGILAAAFPFPSPTGIYAVARAEERRDPANGKSPSTPLRDEGCQPGLAVQGLAEYGVPSSAAWPFDPATINAEPTWGELSAASAFILNGYYAITDTGAARILAVRQAIANGFPVPAGTDVDQPFEDCASDKPITAPIGPLLGGHMISLIGYKPDPARVGRYLFRILNHWSDQWGDAGLAWVTEEFVFALSDLTAIDISESN